jgi:hypothetical protein
VLQGGGDIGLVANELKGTAGHEGEEHLQVGINPGRIKVEGEAEAIRGSFRAVERAYGDRGREGLLLAAFPKGERQLGGGAKGHDGLACRFA